MSYVLIWTCLPVSMLCVVSGCEEVGAVMLGVEWGGVPTPVEKKGECKGRIRVRIRVTKLYINGCHKRLVLSHTLQAHQTPNTANKPRLRHSVI